jgi:hypothetical protein
MVGAVTESAVVHFFEHGQHPPGGLRLTLGQQRKLGYFGTDFPAGPDTPIIAVGFNARMAERKSGNGA